MERIGITDGISFALKRDADGFYICPLCGAPSIYFSDASIHLRDIHKRLAIRKQIWESQ